MNFLLAVHLGFISLIGTQLMFIINKLPAWWCIKFIEWVFLILYILFILCFFYNEFKFMQLFQKVIGPRLKSGELIGESNYRSIIYWQHISETSFDELRDKYKEKNMRDDLLKQIYINSKIVTEKFKYVEIAYKKHFIKTLVILLISLLLGLINWIILSKQS